MKTKKSTIIILIIVALFLSACGPSAGQIATMTATAWTPTPTVTYTPSPTFTPEPIATATLIPSLTPATSGQNNSSDIPADMASELMDLGFELDSGEIGWIQPNPIALLDDGAGNKWLADILAPDPVFQNYVLGVDINWGSWSDDNRGGCGIFLRITENQADAVDFYTSLQPFFNSWDLEHWKSGKFVGSLLKDQGSSIQPGIHSDSINEGTNHYTLSVSGNKVLIYVNGAPIKYVGGNGEVGAEFMPDNLVEGTLAFFARREQGTFTCTFSNGWVWRLD